MNIESILERKQDAIDRLLPTTSVDYKLLDCLLNDALKTLVNDGLLGENAYMSHTAWDSNGQCRLELNVNRSGHVDRVAVDMCFCFLVWYDGYRTHRMIIDYVEGDIVKTRPVSLGQYLDEYIYGN